MNYMGTYTNIQNYSSVCVLFQVGLLDTYLLELQNNKRETIGDCKFCLSVLWGNQDLMSISVLSRIENLGVELLGKK